MGSRISDNHPVCYALMQSRVNEGKVKSKDPKESISSKILLPKDKKKAPLGALNF